LESNLQVLGLGTCTPSHHYKVMGATISVSDHTYLEEERHKGDPRRWTCHLNIQSLVETSGTIVNHICQEALGCKSLLMKHIEEDALPPQQGG
jgi:hypothetical protein